MLTQPPNLDTLIAQLQTVPILRGLDVASLAQLAQSARWRTYAPGAVIFLEGDSATALYYIQTGWVKVVKSSPDGREQILHFLGPGEVFHGMGVFVNRPAPATAIALEETELWLLSRTAINQCLVENPAMAVQIIAAMADRIQQLVTLVTDLSLRSVTERLARHLLDEAADDTLARRRWATQAELAARLGTVPDVLNRALHALSEAGLIQVQRQQIQILDRQGLEAKSATLP